MVIDNTNNKDYWEEYTSYWERKIEETCSGEITNNPVYDDDMLGFFLDEMKIATTDMVLDYGCGSMRIFPLIYDSPQEVISNYYAIDIARRPIEIGLKKYSKIDKKNVLTFDGVNIPFQTSTFDKIICFGVFDATDQEKVMAELLRVLKKGGILLISGKNMEYHDNDEDAIVAERNAQNNKFPNHFTDVKSLKRQLILQNCDLIMENYYERRADFSKNHFINNMPCKFYNWVFLVRKNNNRDYVFEKFSEKESKVLRSIYEY